MFNRESEEDLQTKLDSANAAIAGHPLASEPVTRAHALIESTNSDEKELVNKKLEDAGLPDLAELGKIQVRHSLSWWKLHRERNKIARKLEKLRG